ncbi:hypothetical protein JOC36_000911 [Weissella uvarum]|nr:hypothetical protein [Weissella uvarum]MBM7617354.1 hypothetical protein [Weissella uvarum]
MKFEIAQSIDTGDILTAQQAWEDSHSATQKQLGRVNLYVQI